MNELWERTEMLSWVNSSTTTQPESEKALNYVGSYLRGYDLKAGILWNKLQTTNDQTLKD